jgi:serine protease AprX
MRQDERQSALWGTGSRGGDSRGSALWGKGGRRTALALVSALVAVMLVPLSAVGKSGDAASKGSGSTNVYITDSLLSQAQSNPRDSFNVIVQGNGSEDADKLAKHVAKYATDSSSDADALAKTQISAQFSSINGLAVTLTGKQLAKLVDKGAAGLLAITPNAALQTSGDVKWSSTQLWPYESKISDGWVKDKTSIPSSSVPAIAVVDSGIQADRADFGGRVIGQVNLSTLPGNSASGDQRGHGTFVAGIAADGLPGMTGANPVANLVDVKVLDGTGMGLTSDIINACQWILANKAKYNIQVANFSLHSSITAPFYVDPLDRAVEQLWFNGITVVVAAGNYGSANGPSGVLYSPGDDPFVITVGAADIGGSPTVTKATMAPWSAWGYTPDGFAKPELSAPGRFMIGPVPADSTLAAERPAAVTSPGYMQLSGTSFAAPIISGAAANYLALHPSATPDQVKGALMLTAKGLSTVGGAGGVGVIQSGALLGPAGDNAPNPNLALEGFVKLSSANGVNTPSFDSASWNSTVQTNASWNSASWNSASWNSASWNSASWNSASWNSASWNSASWNSASWNSASWNSASWNSASQEDAAEGDATADTGVINLDPSDVAAIVAADPTFDVTTLPAWLQPTTTTVKLP